MVRGRSTRADHDRGTNTPTRTTGSVRRDTLADPAVPWNARLVQPNTARQDTPSQPVIVEVTAPVVLDGHVRVGAESTQRQLWTNAWWDGDAGQKRVAVAELGANALRLPPGRYEVLVETGGARLNAGRLVIT
jgi:hypothetical protein